MDMHRETVTARLAAGGYIAADEEAAELIAAAAGDAAVLHAMLERRLTGEPLAWITGRTMFCGLELRIRRGVYVPRPHTEQLAQRATRRLPAGGSAIDLCTGSGAVAAVLRAADPEAHVRASDIDRAAVACARSNGVDAYQGTLFDPLPEGTADVVTGVLPYVPTGELALLQRDTLAFESVHSYDGGADGLDVVRRAVRESPRRLRPGGALLLELGAGQQRALADDLAAAGYTDIRELRDLDGDLRGIEATLGQPAG